METVRLTVQIRDHSNMTRVTKHRDVTIDEVEAEAGEMAGSLAKNFSRPKKEKANANH